jgi:2,3-bisphosphoglycerate-independent phosphoglycerate mutase
MYDFYQDLIEKNDSKIVLVVLDGLGGLPRTPGGKTELGSAVTPNLDQLAALSTCGLMEPVLPGITPGSGPAHLALFGYDPVKFQIGRGVLEALGASFPVQPGDLCIRINFATADSGGVITDRRAGRIESSEMERICKKLQAAVSAPGYELFFHPVKEHRAALVLRGPGLYDRLNDTDPQVTGKPPVELKAAEPDKGESTVHLLNTIVKSSWKALADERAANALLLRGIAFYHPLPTMEERYGLRSLALAAYPMYRGLASLVGMTVDRRPQDWEQTLDVLQERWDEFDFFFLHFKKTDSTGEDGDFDRKVGMIEAADAGLPRIVSRGPDVLAVTGDHSTPAVMAGHSWHPVPVLVHSPYTLHDGLEKFDEVHCARGTFGLRPTAQLMAILLAHARRLKKFGA